MKQALQPLKFAIILALGIGIGILVVPYRTTDGNKVSRIMQLIRSNYVDTVNMGSLEKEAISDLLHSLDPHSNYFTQEEARQANEPLEGSFQGIGIEFLLLGDTIYVANVIEEGPSEKAGLHVGDKIIRVDEKKLPGMKLKNDDVFKLLKGKEGSEVTLELYRASENKNLEFKITRGSVKIKSVDAFFMADKETGYIKISRFASNTMDEYNSAFEELKSKGLKNLIIDLRDNGGGYLNTAQKLADEFLDDGKKILTTKGEHTGNESYTATSKGGFEQGKLIVLVNENSASASEILSGALQDNDRALIIGRRTFGKGLVQNTFSLNDGSSIRLTISRYYTPSGRCIQRPYDHGYNEYEEDYSGRYKSGELFIEDSIKKNTSLTFQTLAGRKVYGGGGIIPDVFVPMDTSSRSALFAHLTDKSILREAAYRYAEQHHETLKKYESVEKFNHDFNVDQTLWDQVKAMASRANISWNEHDFSRSSAAMANYLKSYVARQLFKANGFYYLENQNDETYKRALESLKSEQLFSEIKH